MFYVQAPLCSWLFLFFFPHASYFWAWIGLFRSILCGNFAFSIFSVSKVSCCRPGLSFWSRVLFLLLPERRDCPRSHVVINDASLYCSRSSRLWVNPVEQVSTCLGTLFPIVCCCIIMATPCASPSPSSHYATLATTTFGMSGTLVLVCCCVWCPIRNRLLSLILTCMGASCALRHHRHHHQYGVEVSALCFVVAVVTCRVLVMLMLMLCCGILW